jgi:hypothetical protein
MPDVIWMLTAIVAVLLAELAAQIGRLVTRDRTGSEA